MLPNQQDQPATPLQNSAPVDTPQPQPMMGAPVQPVTSASMQQGQKKAKKGLIIGLAIAAAALITAGIFAWLLFFSPAAQAKRASTAFMKAATTNDTETLYKLDGATDDNSKAFLKDAAASVEGSFKLEKKAFQDNTGYFLYSLDNKTNKYARTTVTKKDGKWLVSGFVYSKNTLALVPSQAAEEATTSSETATETTSEPTTNLPATGGKTCLVDADVAPISGGTAESFSTDTYTLFTIETYFFKPDSSEYEYPDQTAEQIDLMKTFYQAQSTKLFTVYLQGKVKQGTSTASGVQLAHDRVAKVRNSLIAVGYPSSRFVEEDPISGSDYADGSERNVDLDIRTPIPCQ